MFHGVHPHGWPARFVGRSRSPLARVESAVSTFSPSPPPSPSPHATRPDLCKNLGMSPWGATTRLINRAATTHRILRVHRVLSTF